MYHSYDLITPHSLSLNKQKIVMDKAFQQELFYNLLACGVTKENIQAISVTGGFLYLKNSHDIDMHIIIKEPTFGMHYPRDYKILGYDCDLIIYTIDEATHYFNDIYTNFHWIGMPYDSYIIYGEPIENFHDYNILMHPEKWQEILDNYYADFFQPPCIKNNKGHKRYWNFLLFYYKVMHKTNKIDSQFLDIIQDAHDLKITKHECMNYFNQLNRYLGGKKYVK